MFIKGDEVYVLNCQPWGELGYRELSAVTERETEIIEVLLEQALVLTGGERAYLLMPQDEGVVCKVSRAASGIDSEEVQYSNTVVQDVISSRKGRVLLDALQEETYSYSESIRRLEIRSIMAAPLLYGDEVLGVIYLDSRVATGVFKEPELKVLKALAAIAAKVVQGERAEEAEAGG